MNQCSICLENINENEKISKWTCTHYFHKECLNYWNKSCPNCRCTTIFNIEKKNKYFDIEYFKTFAKKVSSENYINLWKKSECINDNHLLTFHKTYGVIGVCETCQTVQGFNLII